VSCCVADVLSCSTHSSHKGQGTPEAYMHLLLLLQLQLQMVVVMVED
jgi:hypothetical protein